MCHAVQAAALSSVPESATPKRKPRLNLTDITLHSPSSILGTPFDVSEPRFEYPFPASPPDPDFYPGPSFAPFAGHITSFGPTPPPPVIASTSSSARHDPAKALSPTHLKLQPRDPPVPPSLAKKRWSVSIKAPPQFKLGRPRSPSTKQAEQRETTRTASEERKHTLSTSDKAAAAVCSRSPDATPVTSQPLSASPQQIHSSLTPVTNDVAYTETTS